MHIVLEDIFWYRFINVNACLIFYIFPWMWNCHENFQKWHDLKRLWWTHLPSIAWLFYRSIQVLNLHLFKWLRYRHPHIKVILINKNHSIWVQVLFHQQKSKISFKLFLRFQSLHLKVFWSTNLQINSNLLVKRLITYLYYFADLQLLECLMK